MGTLKNKRGQVAIFFILGIVIVIAIVIFFFMSSSDVDKTAGEPGDVRYFLENCVENAGAGSLVFLGLNGGDVWQNHSVNFEDYNVSYLFYDGESKLETLSKINEDYNEFFDNSLDFCLDNFSEFENMGYEINVKKISSNTFLDESVFFNVDYSIVSRKGDNSKLFEDIYRYNIPVNFTKYYSATENILYMYEELDGNIDFIYLLEQDLNVTISQSAGSLFFILEDEDSIIDDEISYPFIFGLEVENETAI